MPQRKTAEEVQEVLNLYKNGLSQVKIQNVLGFDRSTIRQILNDPEKYLSKASVGFNLNDINRKSYAFILGVYLGDGCISKTHKLNVYRLRIALDQKYKNLNQEIIDELQKIFPNNKIALNNTPNTNGCVISVYSSNLLSLFPQHDLGLKHDRPIVLEEWQKEIIDEFPMDFLRGLMYTDGSFYYSGKYERCNFVNKSLDIVNICSETMNKLNINNCVRIRRPDSKYFAYCIDIQNQKELAKIPFRKT